MTDTLLRIAAVLLPMLYLGVTVGYGYLFFTERPFAKKVTPPLFFVTLALHLVYLVVLGFRYSQFPAASVSQQLSAVAFALAVVYAFVEWHGREASTGFLMLSLAGVLETLSSLLRSPEPPYREIFHDPIFATHTGFGILGYTGFVVAAVYGFLFLRLYSEIKRRRFSLFFDRLPPLEVLERMMTGALLAGFIAFTGTVVSGIVMAPRVFQDTVWWQDPKMLVTFGLWFFYALVLLLRQLHRLQGRQLALASLAGIAAIMFSLLGINFFFTEVHSFG